MRSRAVDKVVYNLFIAARNWLAPIDNLQIHFCQQISRQKTQVKSFRRGQNFSCFLGVVGSNSSPFFAMNNRIRFFLS
jgi:hypothetical protein